MNTVRHNEPLIRIVKRDTISRPKSWGIRIASVLLALLISGLFIYSVTSLNPVDVYKAMYEGAMGTTRRRWITIRDVMVLLCIGVPVVAYIVYDVVRIARRNRRIAAEQGAAMQQKDAEIARLRAMVGAGIEAEREAGGEQLAWGEEELFGDAAPMSEEAPDGEIAMVEEAPDGEIAPMSEEAPDGEIAAMVEEAPDGEAAPMVEEAPDGEIAMVEEAPDGEQAVGEQPAEIAEQPVETAEQPAEIAEEAAEAAEEAAEIAEQPAEVAARPAQDKPAGGGQARRRRRGRKHR